MPVFYWESERYFFTLHDLTIAGNKEADMTDDERSKVLALRNDGVKIKDIAVTLNLSENTIKTFLKRAKVRTEVKPVLKDGMLKGKCKECGATIISYQCRKTKLFCSDKCRMAWWNRNPELVNRKANYEYECAYCKKPFVAYGNSHRKYCCHECYISDRFGGE